MDNSDSDEEHCSNDGMDDSIQSGYVILLIYLFIKPICHNAYVLKQGLFFLVNSQIRLDTFEQLLHKHAIAKLNFVGRWQTLIIRHKYIWTDTKTALSQPEGFMCNYGLSVKFDGEEL